MNLTVLVPTYRRVEDLRRCLHALQAQVRPADEILVTVRYDDDETLALLRSLAAMSLSLRVVSISVPGVVAAMNAGLDAAQGDIIVLTDDDAAPFPDWLARIEAHFHADDRLGGVGGRDWIHRDGGQMEDGSEAVVGRLQWHGRMIGNHHLGVGGPRSVDALKGVNCAYRTTPLRRIRFDTRLRGSGAQVHWELSLGLALKREGWLLVYDPAIGVDHFPAPRQDADVTHRGGFHAASLQNIVYNETLILKDHLPILRRGVFLMWAIAVGTRDTPGLLQVPRLAHRDRHILRRLRATLAGRISGWKKPGPGVGMGIAMDQVKVAPLDP